MDTADGLADDVTPSNSRPKMVLSSLSPAPGTLTKVLRPFHESFTSLSRVCIARAASVAHIIDVPTRGKMDFLNQIIGGGIDMGSYALIAPPVSLWGSSGIPVI